MNNTRTAMAPPTTLNAARRFLPIAVVALLAACGSAPTKSPSTGAVGAAPLAPSTRYYKDDGPGDAPPNHDAVPEAVPKPEPLHRFANRPYTVLGRDYIPATSLRPYRERGVASWYGKKFHGEKTSTGDTYDMYAMTAAHPTLPIPSYVRVTNVANGRSVVVRVNDRGPFHSSRVIDLSYAAAYKLGFIQAGSAQVQLESVQPAREQAGAVYVQVGAFTTRKYAESLQARVTRELAWLQESAQVLLAGNLWRLRVGPYRSSEDARSVADRIAAELDLKPLVVVR